MASKHFNRVKIDKRADARIKQKASCFRDITEYRGAEERTEVSVFRYRAKDGEWRWGWGKYPVWFIVSAWGSGLIFKASSKEDAIRQALRQLEWQQREAKAQYQLLGEI